MNSRKTVGKTCVRLRGSHQSNGRQGQERKRWRQFEREAALALEDRLFGVHGKALALRSQRLSLLASNIANAATPHYKAQDIDFDKALALATKQGISADRAAARAMGYRVPLHSSLEDRKSVV